MDKTVEFESALTTILVVIESVWESLTPEQTKVMRQIESLIDDALETDEDKL